MSDGVKRESQTRYIYNNKTTDIIEILKVLGIKWTLRNASEYIWSVLQLKLWLLFRIRF